MSCDKSTQTPSPPCQAFNHYLNAMGKQFRVRGSGLVLSDYLQEVVCDMSSLFQNPLTYLFHIFMRMVDVSNKMSKHPFFLIPPSFVVAIS